MNRLLQTVKTVKQLGWTEIEYESDYDLGQKLDTKVSINGKMIIWIAGTDIDAFHEELRQLVNKYRI
jgi:hypothetical protein